MARHGNYKELQAKFRQQRKHSRSLNDLYGKNIWTGYEPEKDENYWSFRVSERFLHVCMLSNFANFFLPVNNF